MKVHLTKKSLPLAAAGGLLVCVLALVWITARNYPAEMAQIQAAVIGAEEVQVRMGMFTSEDGLTSSLSQEELEGIAAQFDEKVDQYYAQGTYANTFYKWLNRDYLFHTFQTQVDHCLDGGVSACDLDYVIFSADGREATVKAEVTTWNKWVRQEEDGSFRISTPISRDSVELKLGKEADGWKLKETLSLKLGEEEHTQETEMQNAKALLSANYETYQAARNAALSIDAEAGSSFAHG